MDLAPEKDEYTCLACGMHHNSPETHNCTEGQQTKYLAYLKAYNPPKVERSVEMIVASPVSMYSTRAALLRAGHMLRYHGQGAYDIAQADVLDNLLLREKL